MIVLGLNNRGIRTTKLEVPRHFYEDLLGLWQGRRPAALATRRYWLYVGTNPIIHLIENRDNTGGGDTEPCARINEVGVQYWDRLFKSPIMYQVFVEGPKRLLFELVDRAPGDIDGPISETVD